MIMRDLVLISTGNLRRMKLRTTLTVAGIVIAIAAFVSMVSFGAGTKANIDKQFNDLGLLTTMQVFTQKRPNDPEAFRSPRLDVAALERFGKIPGVLLVYPYDPFTVKVKFRDTLMDTRAQSLSHDAMQTKLFSKLRAGKIFPSDSSKCAIISSDLLKKSQRNSADSVIGKPLIVSVQVSTMDSAVAHLLVDQGETVLDRIRRIDFDSVLNDPDYRGRVIRNEANEAVRRFVNGFLKARRTVSDTLTICGVIETDEIGRMRMEPVIIPFKTAERFSSGSPYGLSGNPTDLFAAMSAGNLFASPDDQSGKSFTRVTINFDPHFLYKPIKDSIEAQGFRTFSFAEEFDQIQKAFIYLDMALGAVGLLALFTASLGIANTMVMSILERKREIGIFKSLGADEGDIRLLFLFESGMIGFIGATVGIITGWIITRIVSVVAHYYMRREGLPEVELFSLPFWLILVAVAFGVGVAVIAGLYPASRAARVDPVEALRGE